METAPTPLHVPITRTVRRRRADTRRIGATQQYDRFPEKVGRYDSLFLSL